MEIEKVIEKIAQKRVKKGYTFENMADELELTPSGYRKIETGESKLSVERLFQIAHILDTPISEFLDIEKNDFIQHNQNNDNVYQQKIEHFYQENRETMEKLILSYENRIKEKEEQIVFLKNLLEKYIK